MWLKCAVHVGIAVLAATIVPVVVGILLMPYLETFALAISIAFLHAAVLGLPIYLLLFRKRKLTCGISIFAGFIIGSIPAAIFLFPDGYDITVLYIWVSYARTIFYAGVFGILGGYAFWLTLHFLNKPNSDEKRDLSPTSPHNKTCPSVVALIVVIASLASFLPPTITRDQSCHNSLRGGGSSISPVLSLDVKMSHDDWPQMTEFFVQFSEEHGLELKDSSGFKPDVYKTLYLSMCHESGFQFMVSKQRWENYPGRPSPIDNIVVVDIFEFGGETNLKPIAQDFMLDAEERWPDKVSIRSGRDYIE